MSDWELRPFGGPQHGEWTLQFVGGTADGLCMSNDMSLPRINVLSHYANEHTSPLAPDGVICTYRCVHRDHEHKTADYLVEAP